MRFLPTTRGLSIAVGMIEEINFRYSKPTSVVYTKDSEKAYEVDNTYLYNIIDPVFINDGPILHMFEDVSLCHVEFNGDDEPIKVTPKSFEGIEVALVKREKATMIVQHAIYVNDILYCSRGISPDDYFIFDEMGVFIIEEFEDHYVYKNTVFKSIEEALEQASKDMARIDNRKIEQSKKGKK